MNAESESPRMSSRRCVRTASVQTHARSRRGEVDVGQFIVNPGGHGERERLAEALDHRVPGTRPFPRDLFDLGLGDPAVASAPVPTLKRGPLPVRDAGAVVDLPLDRVWPGARHNIHFDQVRWWAYAQARGDDLRAWLARVESYALRQNERFPVPVPEVDALATARSVAT